MEKLVDITLFERTRISTAVDSLNTTLSFLQTEMIDRKNNIEMRKLFSQIEKLKEQP